MDTFEVLSHTADIGIRVTGKTLKELFRNAATGMFSFLYAKTSAAPFTATVSVTGIDTEDLLVAWLSELLYLSVENKVFLDFFRIGELTPRSLTARVSGKKIASGQRPLHEIKAVTYHALTITRAASAYHARIFFDV